jgi:hypothetical protein
LGVREEAAAVGGNAIEDVQFVPEIAKASQELQVGE